MNYEDFNILFNRDKLFERTQTKNILIVDDCEMTTGVMKEILDANFNNIYICSNGVEAIDIIKSNKVDLILVDIKMPMMGGVELYENLLQLGLCSNIGLVSACRDEYGCFPPHIPRIHKPISSESLYEIIEKLI